MAEPWPRVHWIHRLVGVHVVAGLGLSGLLALAANGIFAPMHNWLLEFALLSWGALILAQMILVTLWLWLSDCSADTRTGGLIGIVILFMVEGSLETGGNGGGGLVLVILFALFAFFGAAMGGPAHSLDMRIRAEAAGPAGSPGAPTRAPLQWTIRQLMILTVVFGCVLTVISLTIPVLRTHGTVRLYAFVAALTTTITIAFWAPLVSHRPIVWSAAALPLTACCAALFAYLAERHLEIFVVSLLTAWTIIVSLLVARLAGYRAQRPPRGSIWKYTQKLEEPPSHDTATPQT